VLRHVVFHAVALLGKERLSTRLAVRRCDDEVVPTEVKYTDLQTSPSSPEPL
jgi:hypothetical protein